MDNVLRKKLITFLLRGYREGYFTDKEILELTHKEMLELMENIPLREECVECGHTRKAHSFMGCSDTESSPAKGECSCLVKYMDREKFFQ